jgi:hypothetical protein
MSTAFSRALMRLLTAAFLLLLSSDTNARVRVPLHRHHSSPSTIAGANVGALLAAPPQRHHVDTAPLQLLASEASRHDRRAESAPAPTRDASSLRSYERTTTEAARPPPFQA